MRKNETWTLWSRVILILILAVDTRVHAESSYDGFVKGCISLYGKLYINLISYCKNAVIIASKIKR